MPTFSGGFSWYWQVCLYSTLLLYDLRQCANFNGSHSLTCNQPRAILAFTPSFTVSMRFDRFLVPTKRDGQAELT